eukprot:scaffold6401_cov290-Pinguiococcus_pyrenoidosus.AAC.1
MKIHNENLNKAMHNLHALSGVETQEMLQEVRSGLTSLAEHMESSVSFSERRMQLQNLPTSIKIVGRDVIVSQILEDLEPSGSMVAISGTAGIGKSTCAIEVAMRFYAACADQSVL